MPASYRLKFWTTMPGATWRSLESARATGPVRAAASATSATIAPPPRSRRLMDGRGYRTSSVPNMREFLEAIQNGASGSDIAALPLPESYRAAVVLRDEADMFAGLPSEE